MILTVNNKLTSLDGFYWHYRPIKLKYHHKPFQVLAQISPNDEYQTVMPKKDLMSSLKRSVTF